MLICPLKLELWTMQNLSEFRPVITGSHFHVFDRIMRSGPNQKLLPFRAESKCFNNHGGVITVEVSARKKWKPGNGCGCGSDCMTSSLVPASGLQVAAVLCKMFLRLDLFFLLSFFLRSTRRGFLRMDWLRFDCQASSRSQIRMRVCERKRERQCERVRVRKCVRKCVCWTKEESHPPGGPVCLQLRIHHETDHPCLLLRLFGINAHQEAKWSSQDVLRELRLRRWGANQRKAGGDASRQKNGRKKASPDFLPQIKGEPFKESLSSEKKYFCQ